MHDTIANDDITKLDLSKVAALQQKRTLAFVNHFVITTVQFLNNFMRRCENKLMNFEQKLEKVEASMVLLEARLSSIPEIQTKQVELKIQENLAIEPTNAADANKSEINVVPVNKELEETKEDSNIVIPPKYERFIKMVQVGVPLQVVKLNAGIEGLDVDLLEKFINKGP
ncbi:WASH complex subunit 3 [Amyelois transitella]|uniref:WASH complex subunit 3 n=1 Tax=Amyelois transitella TaxID=680683 RepID=UPI0029901DBB|nr:WASH complex subunit 3 [Amyelois transitella]